MSDIQGVVIPKKRVPFVGIIVTIILVLVAGGAGLAWFLGYLTVTIKEPSQHFVLQTSVCDDTVVTRYNEAVSTSSYDDYTTKLKAVFEDVDKLPDHEADATCLFVAYRYYTSQGVSENAKRVVTLIEQHANEGRYPSNKLTDLESIDQIKKRVTTVENVINDTNDAGGAG